MYQCFGKLPHHQEGTLMHFGTHVCAYRLSTSPSIASQEPGMKITMAFPHSQQLLSK